MEEINVGVCDGMTYKEVEEQMPEGLCVYIYIYMCVCVCVWFLFICGYLLHTSIDVTVLYDGCILFDLVCEQ